MLQVSAVIKESDRRLESVRLLISSPGSESVSLNPTFLGNSLDFTGSVSGAKSIKFYKSSRQSISLLLAKSDSHQSADFVISHEPHASSQFDRSKYLRSLLLKASTDFKISRNFSDSDALSGSEVRTQSMRHVESGYFSVSACINQTDHFIVTYLHWNSKVLRQSDEYSISSGSNDSSRFAGSMRNSFSSRAKISGVLSQSVRYTKSSGFHDSSNIDVSALVSWSEQYSMSRSFALSGMNRASSSGPASSGLSSSGRAGLSVLFVVSSELVRSRGTDISRLFGQSSDVSLSGYFSVSTFQSVWSVLIPSLSYPSSNIKISAEFVDSNGLRASGARLQSRKLLNSAHFSVSSSLKASGLLAITKLRQYSDSLGHSMNFTKSEEYGVSLTFVVSNARDPSELHEESKKLGDYVSGFYRESAEFTLSTGPPSSTLLEASRNLLERSFIWSKSNPNSLSLILLVSWLFENSHPAVVSGSQSASVPYSESMALAPSDVLAVSGLLTSRSGQRSRHLTLSNDIIRSNSAYSNFVPTLAVDRSKDESKSDNMTFSEEVKDLTGLSGSIGFVSHSIALSRALHDSSDLWFRDSEGLSISLDPAISHIVGPGPFPAGGPIADASAQGAGVMLAILGGVIPLLLLLACLVLFLLWRRKKKRGSDPAAIPDDSDAELESSAGNGSDCDHEYWNPLDSDLSTMDEDDCLPDGTGADMDEYVDGSGDLVTELSDWFASEGNPLISDGQQLSDGHDDLSFSGGGAEFEE